MPDIGTLNEGGLHAAIKDELAEPGDRFEVELDGFVIDLVRNDLLVEVQTGSFGAMGRKLDRLLGGPRLHLVHPIAVETWLVRAGKPTRKSPKRGSIYDLFPELASVPTLLDHPNLSLEVLLVQQDAHRVADPTARRGLGGWRTVDRRLRAIVDRQRFDSPADLLGLVPASLPPVFTTADLATAAAIPRRLAQAMAYCLRHNELLVELERRADGIRYRLAPGTARA